MVTTFSMILSLGFNVYFFPIYHIMSGLRAIFSLKTLKLAYASLLAVQSLKQLLITAFIAPKPSPGLNKALAFSGFLVVSHAISAFI